MSFFRGGAKSDFSTYASIYKRVYEIPGNRHMASASPSWSVLSIKDANNRYKYPEFIFTILNQTDTMSNNDVRNLIEEYINTIQQYERNTDQSNVYTFMEEEPESVYTFREETPIEEGTFDDLEELIAEEFDDMDVFEESGLISMPGHQGFVLMDDYVEEVTNDLGFAQTNGLISDHKLNRLLKAINKLTERIETIAVDLNDLNKAMKIIEVANEIVKEDISIGDMETTAQNIEMVDDIIKEEVVKKVRFADEPRKKKSENIKFAVEPRKPKSKKKCKPGQVLKTVTYKKKSGKTIGPYEQCVRKKCKPGEKLEITKGYKRRSGKQIKPYGRCVKKKTQGGLYMTPYERLLAAGVI